MDNNEAWSRNPVAGTDVHPGALEAEVAHRSFEFSHRASVSLMGSGAKAAARPGWGSNGLRGLIVGGVDASGGRSESG
jgi:hypothetical protein